MHGRHSYEGGPRAARRKRLVVTRQIASIRADPSRPAALLWNPAGASLEDALAGLDVSGGVVAIIGGTDVFGMFLSRYDVFHLTRAAFARIPGGRPLFPSVGPDLTPEVVLAEHGLTPGPRSDLDEAAGITLTSWTRDQPAASNPRDYTRFTTNGWRFRAGYLDASLSRYGEISSKPLFTLVAALSSLFQPGHARNMMRTLPLIDELESALSSGTNTRRIEMLTRITDLFVGGATRYSEDQIGVFDDVMVRLTSTIEAKARARLANRLAPIANAPASVVHMLAFDDDIDVARPILRQSERLDDSVLLANANTKSQQHLFAISQRRSLSEAVTEVLVERGDRDVVHSVVKNAGARFSDAGFRMLVKRSVGDDDLATIVGMRGDIPRTHFLVLLEKASSAVRARLAVENPQAGTAIDGVVAEVVGGIRNDARNASPDFAAAQAAVERLNRIRRIGEAEVYHYARDRKFEETAIALSILCETPIDVVERALLDPGAEIVLILAKVAGLSSTTTKAILLLRAADRGMSAKDLDNALASFNRLQPDTARRVLGFFRTRVKKPAQPMVPPAVAVSG